MAVKRAVSILSGFFNQGEGESIASTGGKTCPATMAGVPVKRSVKDFAGELKALNDTEKAELATLVCAVTGDTLAA